MEYLLYKDQEDKFNISDYSKEKLLYLLIDRPDKINIFGEFVWEDNKKQRHRNYNLPALIFKIQIYSEIGSKYMYYFEWYRDGKKIK